jgi:cysteine desulfurase/selenocysteine lyase
MVREAKGLTLKSVDFNKVRNEFSAFRQTKQHYHYLDSAASSQKPDVVIDAIKAAYQEDYAPIHRGLYSQAAKASHLYENARKTIAEFINAPKANNIIFTRSATESINLVAQGWAKQRLQAGDQIWVSEMEHHANFLPWQRVCLETGATLCVISVNNQGQLDIDQNLVFNDKTKFISLTLLSNVLGTINPLKEIISKAHSYGIPVLVDAAQALSHLPIDVQDLDCDFLVGSAHKMCGPTGIGLLFGKSERLEETEPFLLGGGMVDEVNLDKSTWAEIPTRFEAGSPNYSGAIGFAAAVDYLNEIGLLNIKSRVEQLTHYAHTQLKKIPSITIYGSPCGENHSGIISFNLDNIHPHDVAQLAGEEGVAIRAGHHCCQPLMNKLNISSTNRISISLYNNEDDIDALFRSLFKATELFSVS